MHGIDDCEGPTDRIGPHNVTLHLLRRRARAIIRNRVIARVQRPPAGIGAEEFGGASTRHDDRIPRLHVHRSSDRAVAAAPVDQDLALLYDERYGVRSWPDAETNGDGQQPQTQPRECCVAFERHCDPRCN